MNKYIRISLLLTLTVVSCKSVLLYKDVNRLDKLVNKEGPWLNVIDSTNQIAFQKYKNNKKHGLYILYFENGQIAIKGKYKNDKKHGIWRSYLSSGGTCSLTKYKRGKLKKNIIINPIW